MEPLERGNFLADPDEFDTTETGWWVWTLTFMPDTLEDGGPWSDTNTSTDENSDFVFEDIFCWCSVWSVDAESWHLSTISESDLEHCGGIHIGEFHSLGVLTSAESLTEISSEVTNLTDVN